jgi:hypothetical protein
VGSEDEVELGGTLLEPRLQLPGALRAEHGCDRRGELVECRHRRHSRRLDDANDDAAGERLARSSAC